MQRNCRWRCDADGLIGTCAQGLTLRVLVAGAELAFNITVAKEPAKSRCHRTTARQAHACFPRLLASIILFYSMYRTESEGRGPSLGSSWLRLRLGMQAGSPTDHPTIGASAGRKPPNMLAHDFDGWARRSHGVGNLGSADTFSAGCVSVGCIGSGEADSSQARSDGVAHRNHDDSPSSTESQRSGGINASRTPFCRVQVGRK